MKLCVAVDKETKTTGNIPKGNYELGDEYICEVTSGKKYHFFILSKSEDGEKINLIMDSNINESGEAVDGTQTNGLGLVAWDISGTNVRGPVTAMYNLNEATKNWIKVPNLDEIWEGILPIMN